MKFLLTIIFALGVSVLTMASETLSFVPGKSLGDVSLGETSAHELGFSVL